MKQNYNKEYIEHSRKQIREVMNDEKEYDDWTQICFSIGSAYYSDKYNSSRVRAVIDF